MSQKTTIFILAGLAICILAGAGVFFAGGGFGFGGGNDRDGHNARHAKANPFADEADPFGPFNPVGEDEHGAYELTTDGRRIYIDSEGRRYTLENGKRTYVDRLGNVLREGRAAGGTDREGRAGSGAGDASSTGTGGTGDAGDRSESEPEKPLDPGALSGQVVDDFGNPYPGATVVAVPAGAEQRTASTNEEGRFALADMPAQVVISVVARDKWGNSSKALNTRLAAGAKLALADPLVLPRDTSIRGTVRSSDDGSPLAGAAVILLLGGQSKASVTTSGDGSFEFSKLAPEAYRVQVTREGYTPRIFNNVNPPMTLDAELAPGTVISGVVSDGGGNPVANARVACDFHAEPNQHFHTEAFTDESGFYAVKCQPESQHNTLTVVAAGFKSQQRTLVRSGDSGINFKLEPSGNVVLRGRLLTRSGVPVTAASFTAFGADGKSRKVHQSIGPGADGAFWCEVAPDASQLRVKGPGLSQLKVDYAAAPGGEVELGDLYLDAGYAVFGIVHDGTEAQTPIANAEVSVGSTKVQTDAEGKYRIEGLNEEPFIVRVLHAAYLGTAITITPVPGEHEIERNIALSKSNFEARAIVKHAETGEPLPGVKLTATDYGQVHTTGADGLVTLTGLSSMKINVVLEKAGFAKLTLQLTADVSDKVSSAPPQEVLMTPGSTITGVCTTAGSPLPATSKVEIWNASQLVATLLTDTEGRYTSDALPLGVYFIGLPEFHYVPRAVALVPEGLEHDIEIGVISHVRGTVKRSNGQPHANAGIYVYRRDNVYWSATIYTDPEGRYECTNLFPGTWVFCALKTQADTAAQFAVDVEITKAGWSDINVQLPQITGVITGRVTYPSGQPVAGARVSVTNLTANFPRALLAAYVVTDATGHYRAERLENGAQMIVRVGGYQDQAATGTAFSQVLTVPSNDTPVEADLVVAESGLTIRVTYSRADAGPLLDGGPLCYLVDAQGRLSGLYFGGGRFAGHVDLYDVIPGEYTLHITHRGCKLASVQLTVGETAPTGVHATIELEPRGS